MKSIGKRNYFAKAAAASVIIFALAFGCWLNFAPRHSDNAQAAGAPDGLTTGCYIANCTNEYYVYLDPSAGETLDVAVDRTVGVSVNVSVVDPDANEIFSCVYTPASPSCASNGLAGATAGVYKISIVGGAGVNNYLYTYDFTVRDSGGNAIAGRTWVYKYGMSYATAIADTPVFSPTFYVVTDAGYTYRLTLRDYNAYAGELAVNSSGLVENADSCVSTYQSTHVDGTIYSADGYVNYGCGLARLFLEAPDPNLPAAAPSADGEVKILPPILSADSVILSAPTFARDPAWTQTGELVYSLDPNFAGNYTLQIDVNNNGSFNDAVDRSVSAAAPGGAGNAGIATHFDGLDGLGQPVPLTQAMQARIYIGKIGEVHVVLADTEQLGGGITMERLTGPSAPEYTIYWDDTQIPQSNNFIFKPENLPLIADGTAGVDSSDGVHGWWADQTNTTTVGMTSYGNQNLMDFWTYASTAAYSDLQAIPPTTVRRVVFEENGGSLVDDQTVEVGARAVEPTPPTRAGYDFGGWYIDEKLTAPYDFSSPVNENITLYAKWTRQEFTVKFVDGGGDLIDAQTVFYGDDASAPTPPARPHYRFVGWDKTFDDVTGDLIVTALYREDAKCDYNSAIYFDDAKCAAPTVVLLPPNTGVRL